MKKVIKKEEENKNPLSTIVEHLRKAERKLIGSIIAE
jgi:hypothetical protein